MSMCYRCNPPAFDGAASHAGPQCKCWSYYKPEPVTTDVPRHAQCNPVAPLTEEDVRRIVGETKLPPPGSPEASAMIDSVLAEYNWPANPKNAARAGYEAARRLLAPNVEVKSAGALATVGP